MAMRSHKVSDYEMIEAFTRNQSARAAAVELGVSAPTVLRCLGRHKIPHDRATYIRAVRRKGITDNEIIEAYNKAGRNGAKAAIALGLSDMTVYNTLAEHGIQTRRPTDRNTSIKNDDIPAIRLLVEAGAKLNELAKAYNCDDRTIALTLQRHGIPYRGRTPIVILSQDDKDTIVRLIKQGVSYKEAGKAIGQGDWIIQQFIHRAHPELKPPRYRSRETSPRWKGGRINHRGYVYVLLTPDDPLFHTADSRGYALEHRVVLARHFGRPLGPNETCHHINGDKTDNRLENLQLRQGRHGKGKVLCCLDCGSRNVGEVALE